MKVQCSLCEFERNGLCTKKTRGGKPITIKVNKRRQCDKYSEDAGRVLAQFRKREAHRAAIKKHDLRRAQLAKAIEMAKKEGVKSFTEDNSSDKR